MSNKITYQKFITREDLQANPDKVYVFGDNLERRGLGGQAKEMRGEPNALGIPTKCTPWVYLSDEDYYEWLRVFDQSIEELKKCNDIVWPADGIGTGLAQLRKSAPKIWATMQKKLYELGIKNGNE